MTGASLAKAVPQRKRHHGSLVEDDGEAGRVKEGDEKPVRYQEGGGGPATMTPPLHRLAFYADLEQEAEVPRRLLLRWRLCVVCPLHQPPPRRRQ